MSSRQPKSRFKNGPSKFWANTQASITSPTMDSLNSSSSSEGVSCGDDANNLPPPLNTGCSGTTCGNILDHYVIPNTSLVLIAFSAGYFTLVDWANGTILSDAEVASHRVAPDRSSTSALSLAASTHLSSVGGRGGDATDHFLLDVAFHAPTSTFACITHSGHIAVYQIWLMDNSTNPPPTTIPTQVPWEKAATGNYNGDSNNNESSSGSGTTDYGNYQ